MNWAEQDVQNLLDIAEESFNLSVKNLKLRGRVIRKKRALGLVPNPKSLIPREALDETVLCVQEKLQRINGGRGPALPYCCFNGGKDCWVDVGNKRVGVKM